MIPYFILLTVPILLNPFVKDTTINHVKMNKLPLFLFFAFFTVMVMARHHNVGSDTNKYIYIFQRVAQTSWNRLTEHSLEPGFQLFSKLISLLSKDPQVFLAAAGLMVSALLYPTFRRLCIDAPLTIVLFCVMSIFPMMLSGIRQMMAIGFGMIAYAFVRRRKPILFLLMVAAAMSFHTSAFMLLFMYPLFHARITKKWAVYSIPILAAAFAFNRQIFDFLGALLQSYTRYEVIQTSTGAYTTLILFLLFTLFSYVIPDESLLDDEMIGLRNFMLLSLVLQMFAPLNTLAMRMNYYYIIFIPLLVPRIILYSSARYRSVAAWSRNIMLVFFLAYFFMNAKPGINTASIGRIIDDDRSNQQYLRRRQHGEDLCWHQRTADRCTY